MYPARFAEVKPKTYEDQQYHTKLALMSRQQAYVKNANASLGQDLESTQNICLSGKMKDLKSTSLKIAELSKIELQGGSLTKFYENRK